MMATVIRQKTAKQSSVETPFEMSRKNSRPLRAGTVALHVFDQIFDDPSSDDRVVWNDQNRDNGVDPAPAESHFDLPNDWKAPTGLFRVMRPMADSATIME